MLNFLYKILQQKTTTFEKAKKMGEITQEVEVYPSKTILVCGEGIYEYESERELSGLVSAFGGGQLEDNNKGNLACEWYCAFSDKSGSLIVDGGHYQSTSRAQLQETNHAQKNFHFRDIFGNYHRFFRPYTRTLPPLKVRAFAHAYCYSDSSEILITASRKALISQTSYMTHEFAPPPALNTPRKILFILKTCLKWLRFYTTRPQRIDGTLAIMHQSSNYFHYLVESVSSMLQIIHSGLRVDYYVLDTSTPFAREMIEILQIPREKILSPKPHRLLRADSLLLPTLTADVETIEYRDRLLFAHALSLPLNIRDFYASLSTPTSYMSASHTPTSCPTRKVFLTRPMDSNRNIENLQEVQAVFGEFGYEIVLPDNLSLREQIALMRECKIIASMHGAGLANVLFAPSGAVVFEIFSEYYHDFGPQMCALLRKHRYMYMVGKTRDTSMHPQQENAYIHPEHLRHALKILEYESN